MAAHRRIIERGKAPAKSAGNSAEMRVDVYTAATAGNLKQLKVFLEQRSKDEVGHLVDAKTHGSTPLVMACRNGHYDVAEYLIQKCGADIEQPGPVIFDDETIEGAPPLWCAAAIGHTALVRLLVASGANMNCTTRTNSTPLRAACFDGHYDIVKFLVHSGADIEIANNDGHTCLMIACFRGHVQIVRFLLKMGADPNRKSVKGNTALHDCAENGSLEILGLLIAAGARLDADSYGITPILDAAIAGHTDIVRHLAVTQSIKREERIDAWELLGATYVDRKKDMINALKFWKRAMTARFEISGPPIPKPPQRVAISAYNFAQEVHDPNRLDQLLEDPDDMRMQALLIRERILGPAHPDTSYYIRYRGAAYADAAKYERCVELWKYALDMQQRVLGPLDPTIENTFVGFAELFSYLLGSEATGNYREPQLPERECLIVFKQAVAEVARGKEMLDKLPASERDLTRMTRILTITVHLALLVTYKMPNEDTQAYSVIHDALYQLVQINAKGKEGRDVLQLAVSQDDVFTRHQIAIFSPANLTTALLRVGANIEAKDDNGNTALHLIGCTQPWRKDLVTILLEAGAHIDIINKKGKTFEMLLNNKRLYDSINPLKYTRLACLAARVVRRTQSISNVPEHLIAFIKMH